MCVQNWQMPRKVKSMYLSPINYQSGSLKFNQNKNPNFTSLRIKSSHLDSGFVLTMKNIEKIIAVNEKKSTIISYHMPCTSQIDLPFSAPTLEAMLNSNTEFEHIKYSSGI